MSRKNSKAEPFIKDIVILGDTFVGKTSLLNRFRNDYFEEKHEATIYDRADFELIVDNIEHIVRLHDTNSHQRLYLSRRSIYDHASCIVVCYSVDNHASYQSIVCNWTKEFMIVRRMIPLVLVATKVDLRGTGINCVTTIEGDQLKRQINANSFIECSAKDNIQVKEAIHEAVRASINGVVDPKQQNGSVNDEKCCWICPANCTIM